MDLASSAHFLRIGSGDVRCDLSYYDHLLLEHPRRSRGEGGAVFRRSWQHRASSFLKTLFRWLQRLPFSWHLSRPVAQRFRSRE